MINIKRVSTLPHNEAIAIYHYISKGQIKRYIDDYGYVCYDPEELKNLKPKKRGRKPKI